MCGSRIALCLTYICFCPGRRSRSVPGALRSARHGSGCHPALGSLSAAPRPKLSSPTAPHGANRSR